MIKKLLILNLFFFFSLSFAQVTYKKEINHLLSYILKSDCHFERNGKFYEPDKVKKHLLYKKDYFKEKINSTEEFIKYAATKSELSGKKYKVHCKNKEIQELNVWLYKELVHYRKDN